MIGRLFAKLFGFYPVVVQFANGRYGVRANRMMSTFYDRKGDSWISKNSIEVYCQFNTLEEAKAIQQKCACSYKVIKA